MTERLLFATRRPPFPLDNGAKIRAHRLAGGLAKEFEVVLLTFAHDPASPDGAPDLGALRASLPDVEIVTVRGLGAGKRWRQALSLASPRSFEFGRYRLRRFGAELDRLSRAWRPNVVHFDDPAVAAFGPMPGALNVFFPPNIEHRVIRDNARAAGLTRRAFGEVEWRRVQRDEFRAAQMADLCVAVSDADAGVLRVAGVRRVEICPNGTDRVETLPPPRRESGETFRMLFIGSGAYRPYEVGLAWFLESVYPRLAEVVPSSFDVVGERPKRPREGRGVTYHGRVPSVSPYYERAHALVVPVFEGSGTRLKVIEAAALGRPIVSTTLGAEGLGLSAGIHYRRADDAATFASELIALARELEQPTTLTPMLHAARSVAEGMFWDVITEKLVNTYRAAALSREAVRG
ncbi:MAG: glycosyltransferase family 4 protein [Solirubrobacteraceae bacterium]